MNLSWNKHTAFREVTRKKGRNTGVKEIKYSSLTELYSCPIDYLGSNLQNQCPNLLKKNINEKDIYLAKRCIPTRLEYNACCAELIFNAYYINSSQTRLPTHINQKKQPPLLYITENTYSILLSFTGIKWWTSLQSNLHFKVRKSKIHCGTTFSKFPHLVLFSCQNTWRD